ncbi:hypothetical protein DKL61_09300 [Gammaproteobacteria bacterium ESL0073]|nr:hypothetical protein DKL61_09300 [Gammaproteobacteria bacterium ESL0073]
MRIEQGVKVVDSGLDQSIAKLLNIEPDEYVVIDQEGTKFHMVIGSIILGLTKLTKGVTNPCVGRLETAIEIAKMLNGNLKRGDV